MKLWLRAHGFTSFLAVACVALSGQVLVLARENRALKATHARSPDDPRGTLFEVGERFFPFELRTLADERLEVRFDAPAQRTLLFLFAEACPVCPQILPKWQEIAPHFLASGARVLGCMFDRPSAGAPEPLPGVPVGSFADLSRLPLSKLRTVPLTVLVDAAGAIEWVHYGTLTDARMIELMARL